MKKLMFVNENSYEISKKYDVSSGSIDMPRRELTLDTQDENSAMMGEPDSTRAAGKQSSEDRLLKNAASIGTALMIVNSHRAMALL